ncbi:MAG: hypothetical protein WC254_05525, partial [Candidatus Woesearchaeota archaeon]
SIAKSTEFQIIAEYPFTLANNEDEIKSVGDVPVYDSTKMITGESTITYKILVDKEVKDGEYDLRLAYRTEGGISRGDWIEFDAFNIKVGGRATNVVIAETKTNPERTAPGQETQVTLVIANNGNSIINDATITLNLDETTEISPYKTSNEAVISTINGRESVNVTFDLIITPDAKVKVYEIPVKMTYNDLRNNAYEKTTYISIVVDAEPEYVLNLEETEVYTEGQSGNIVMSLSNIGVSNINYATLMLLPSEYYTVLSTDTVYIGNLESDDYETAQFNIYANDYTKELPLQFRLLYKDTYNVNYDEEITVNMNMFSSWQAKRYGLVQGSSLWLIIIIFLGVAAGGWYWWKRAKKVKKG